KFPQKAVSALEAGTGLALGALAAKAFAGVKAAPGKMLEGNNRRLARAERARRREEALGVAGRPWLSRKITMASDKIDQRVGKINEGKLHAMEEGREEALKDEARSAKMRNLHQYEEVEELDYEKERMEQLQKHEATIDRAGHTSQENER